MTSIVDADPLSLHLGIGHRGPSGQDVRPDLATPSWTPSSRRIPNARVACETATTTGLVMVLGEITTRDLRRLPGGRPRHRPGHRLHPRRVRLRLPDLRHARVRQGAVAGHRAGRRRGARGARRRAPDYDELGAGDQGMMFGFACRETPELMPLPIALAHRMARRLAEVRKSGQLPLPAPGRQDPGHRGVRGRRARCACTRSSSPSQHDPDVHRGALRDEIIEHVILPSIDRELRPTDPVMHVNPTGRFVTGGPMGDAGLTGRKIIVDTYGGMARHGGGAFSGKDPTKVDRSAAYAARWVAKNVVAAGLADRFEVEVAYGIGIARPVSPLGGVLRHGHHPGRGDPGAHRARLRPAPGGHHRRARTCGGRSTARRRPTATSVGRTSTCPGSARTRSSAAARPDPGRRRRMRSPLRRGPDRGVRPGAQAPRASRATSR